MIRKKLKVFEISFIKNNFIKKRRISKFYIENKKYVKIS